MSRKEHLYTMSPMIQMTAPGNFTRMRNLAKKMLMLS